MHPEVKVGVKFIVSYLHNKLPRRRADLFGEELEKILMSRFEGHWYPEAPLKCSAFRCLNLGGMRDPVVELAAKKSGLEPAEVHAHVPADLSVWIDPYKVSYQIGERGLVKVLSFNPDAQEFVPFGLSAQSHPGLFSYPSSSMPTDPAVCGGPIVSKLSPNAKEFVSKGSPGTLYFDDGTQPMQPHASPFQTPQSFNAHPSFDPFSSPPPGQGVFGSNGQISYMEQPPFVEGFGSYNLQYQSQCFQPVVLAN